MSIKIMSLVWEHYPTGGGELLSTRTFDRSLPPETSPML